MNDIFSLGSLYSIIETCRERKRERETDRQTEITWRFRRAYSSTQFGNVLLTASPPAHTHTHAYTHVIADFTRYRTERAPTRPN